MLAGLYPTLLARRVVGTDIVHAVPLTLLAGMGHIDLTLPAGLLAGSVPGILIGSRITGRLPDWMLRVALSIILLYAAYLLVNKEAGLAPLPSAAFRLVPDAEQI